MTRFLPLALLVSLAGCAGHVADYVGPRASIVSPQLIRYGLSLEQSRCVGEQLGLALRPLQLRLFARAAGAVQRGYFEPARLTMRDLLWVATSMGDPGVASALERANAGCGVAIVTGDAPPLAVAAAAPAAPRASAWLNLGAAGSGQSIAIDASTIEQEGRQRSAWFRLTDPGAAPSPDSFQLDIDCARRTINPRARRRRDAAGAVADYREYPANPLPVEGGTVMEIAFLSLCT